MSFLWVKRLTSSSFSYCLVLEFAHKSGYGVIMHFYKLFRVLTLFSENCSYNTLRFIFIILLPVKAAWSHDDDDESRVAISSESSSPASPPASKEIQHTVRAPERLTDMMMMMMMMMMIMGRLRCLLSFTLLRWAVTCFRGCRSSYQKKSVKNFRSYCLMGR